MFEKLGERYTKIFERPAPIVSCDQRLIEGSCAPGFFHDYFIVKNIGGGNLEGDVFAQSSFVSFSSQVIEGNDVIIEYEIDLNHLKPGDVFKSQIVLTTSGGQLVIPVTIQISNYSLYCGLVKVNSLYDFCTCVEAIPEEASKLFVSEEFEKWLVHSKCPHMQFYHKLLEDGVGMREMDSFLTLCGAKEKARVRIKKKHQEIRGTYDQEVLRGNVPMAAVTWGYFEYQVRKKSDAPWLVLSKDRLTNSDFVGGKALYDFSINMAMIESPKVFETIVFERNGEREEVKITVYRPKLFTAALSRLSYGNEDSGYLIIDNHTGKDGMMEITTSEKFVRFRGEKYLVEKHTVIPFEIKVNSFLNLGIGKKPINSATINCRTVIDGKVYKESLVVKAGSLLNRL